MEINKASDISELRDSRNRIEMHPNRFLIARNIFRSRAFILTFVALFVLFSVAEAMSHITRESEAFLTMSTLGSDMKVENYFPKNNNTISVGEHIVWYVNVHNAMNDPEYVLIKIKLLNSTQVMPAYGSNQTTLEPTILELPHLVPANATWIAPLNWTIVEAINQNGHVNIKRMTINGEETAILDSRSVNGQDFRMVLELWRYNNDSKDFEFGWSSLQDTRNVWNQIWFNVTK